MESEKHVGAMTYRPMLPTFANAQVNTVLAAPDRGPFGRGANPAPHK
jgi:hypothetical protein